MPGAAPPEYMRLSGYATLQHQKNLRLIQSVMVDCEIKSIEVDNGELRLNYEDGNVDIIEKTEFEV